MKKLGILGGGQLGKMLIQAAANYAIDCHILDPDATPPAKSLAASFTHASLQDEAAILTFAKDVDILTIEIENVNTSALKKLEKQGKKVYPQPHIIELVQDKGRQKQFYKDHHLPTSDFRLIDGPQDLTDQDLGKILKSRVGGYDGKGVMALSTPEALNAAFQCPCVVEEKVSIDHELSVIVARTESGEMATFPPIEMVVDPHANLVDFLMAPAQLPQDIQDKAKAIATQCAQALGIVGILAVELFVTPDSQVLINEIAPRPHNSGHHTIEANQTSQYDQHLRAVMGWPLGSTQMVSPAGMWNILGPKDLVGNVQLSGLETLLKHKEIKLHWYGKTTTKPYRKLGHITVLSGRIHEIQQLITQLKTQVQVTLASANPTESTPSQPQKSKVN